MSTPADALIDQQLLLLRRHAPFDAMADASLRRLLEGAEQCYFAPGESICAPEDGPARALYIVKTGCVSAQQGLAELDRPGRGWQYEAGDCFPIAALMNERAVTARYQAEDDVFAWRLNAALVREVAAQSPELAAHLSARVLQLIQLADRAQAKSAQAAALAEQRLEQALGSLMRTQLLSVSPDTPLELALRAMAQRRVGSVLVADRERRLLGLLSRDEVLERVTLPQRSLQTPIERVMSPPVHTLTVTHSAQDAALLMSRHTLGQVPVLDAEGRLAGIVSERDLFAHSRWSVQRVGSELRGAVNVEELVRTAPRIRELARQLGQQGVAARTLTGLIAHLNDLFTERLVQLQAEELGLDLDQAAWLAFGSEGRGEQTVATDQDNGIVFAGPASERPRWLALGKSVCTHLAEAGVPLCKGGIMASEPDCCRSSAEWQDAFRHWLGQGTPEDLLRVSIFFDARAVAGHIALAQPLRELAQGPAQPRFLRLMAANALLREPPLSWRGALDADEQGGLELKLRGSALFVEAARLLALATGVAAVGTRERLLQAGAALGVAAPEREGWAAAFDFLQGLRLRQQLADPQAGNWVRLSDLNDLDRRTLRVSLRVLQRLQERIRLDYLR